MNEQSLPVMSPCLTKKVSSALRFTVPSSVSLSHHDVLVVISPFWLMKADMPVLAHLAMSLLVSMALSEE